MSTPPILCEQCQIREARVHLTQITDGVRRSHDWCEECYGQMTPSAALPDVTGLMAAMAAAHCKYCGGQPCVNQAIPDREPTPTGDIQTHGFMCEACQREFTNFYGSYQERIRSGPLEDRRQAIHEFLAELENHLIRAAKQRSQEPPEK